MPKLPFITQSSRSADDIGYSTARLINVYPEVGPQDGKGPVLLRSVLGRSAFADTSTPVLRAMEYLNGNIYIVTGGRLFSIAEGGNVTNLAAIADDVITTISSNGIYITVVAGGIYYVWDGVTLTTPGSGRISSVGTVGHLDHYTLMTELDGDEHEWTTLADPTSRNSLYFATNEANNDNTLRVITDRLYAWYFGTESTEVWYNTGQSGADALARLSGGAMETGLLAANLLAKTESGLFLIGDDKIAYITVDSQMQPISTPAVNEAIEGETPSHCFYYEDRGHRFCVVRFTNRPAWVYDIATGLWHERSTGVGLGAWDVVSACRAWNKYYCGTTQGVVYLMDRSNTDVTCPLKRYMISSSLDMAGDQFSVAELELLGEYGSSTSEANIVFRISSDGGRSFGSEITRSAGTQGEYLTRVVLRALGRYRNFVIEVTITDATDINIYSQMNVKVT